jgi:predicted DNA-binding ArsR family transcriptional regulator
MANQPPPKSYIQDQSALVSSIKQNATSRVAIFRKKSKTLFGRDLSGGWTDGAKIDADVEEGRSLHYFRNNHLQKAWKLAGESGGQEERD